MSKDKFQDKYGEVFQNLKDEKMDWDFEDFLQKAENKEQESKEAEIIPLDQKKPSFPKWFWMAACIILLFGIGFIYNYNQNADVQDQAKLVKDEVLRQKTDFIEENHEAQQQVAVSETDSIPEAKKDSLPSENIVTEKDILDEILPKRGRLKKETRPRFVDNSSYKNNMMAKKDTTGYQDNYVIVNGKKIENVEEAINVTKYSFQIFANNVSEKLAQPKAVDDGY